MNHLKYFFLIFAIPSVAISQEVKVLNFQYQDIENKDHRLDYLEDLKDTANLTYIAELQITHPDLYALYYRLHHKSTALGAEIYSLKSFDYDSTETQYNVSWDIYHSTDSIRQTIRNKAEKNAIYIFSFPKEGVLCKVNNVKIDIPAGHFLKFSLEGRRELKIRKGGFFGTTQWIDRFNEDSNLYIYFGGAELTPVAGFNSVGVSVGVNVKTGNILYHEIPIGIFLSKAFNQLKKEEDFKLNDLR